LRTARGKWDCLPGCPALEHGLLHGTDAPHRRAPGAGSPSWPSITASPRHHHRLDILLANFNTAALDRGYLVRRSALGKLADADRRGVLSWTAEALPPFRGDERMLTNKLRTAGLSACAILLLAAGTAAAQTGQQYDPWGYQQQDRFQQDRFTTRGFETDQERWRTTTDIPQLRGVELKLAQLGHEQDTFVNIEDGQIVAAYVDGRLVPRQNVQVRGNQIRIIGHDGDVAGVFRIPTAAQVLASPERFGAFDTFSGPQQPRMGQMHPMTPRQREMMRQRMHDPQVMHPGMGRVLGTPDMPVADLSTSAIGILMFQAQQHDLRGTQYRQGVLIEAVQEGLPAHQAGLRPGDIIVAVDQREDVTPERLKNHLRRTSPGERLSLTVVRDGRERNINVRTTEVLPIQVNWDYMVTGLEGQQLRQQQMMLDRHRQVRSFRDEGRIFGIGLSEADEDDLEEFDEYEDGVEVTQITPGTAMYQAGLRRGDIIVSVDGQRNISKNELKEILKDKSPGEQVRMTVIREGQQRNLNVRIGENFR
jgi:membrane-associated protease RseP (regulator of RpoE activity)